MLIKGFNGVYPAVVSPKDDSGVFSAKRMEALISRLYESNVHGLYLCGNTGEGYLLPLEARKEAVEVAVEASKGKGKVIVHVGAPAERDAVALAKHAAEAGADAISSLPPYVQGYSFDEVYAHYTRLAYASGLPAFVYYIPVITHREFSLDEIEQLLDIEGVAGLKFTNHNLYLMEGIMDGGRNPHVFNGHDEVFSGRDGHGGLRRDRHVLQYLACPLRRYLRCVSGWQPGGSIPAAAGDQSVDSCGQDS